MHRLNVDSEEELTPTYAGRGFSHAIPKYRIPADGVPADSAYQLVHDELNLDGNPALNLASFVTSWMEPQADRLAVETLAKNMIDQDEYPQTEAIHERVVSMIGRLFHAPGRGGATGTATHAINGCSPDCAQGTYTKFPVEVRLSDPGYLNGMFVFQTITAIPTGAAGQTETTTATGLYGTWGWPSS